MNPKDGFDFNEICGHFLIKAEGGAKNYKCDHPLPLTWRSFTVAFVQRKGYLNKTPVSEGAARGLGLFIRTYPVVIMV